MINCAKAIVRPIPQSGQPGYFAKEPCGVKAVLSEGPKCCRWLKMSPVAISPNTVIVVCPEEA